MNAIQFTAMIGPDGVIRPPAGVNLPEGELQVSIQTIATEQPSLEQRARDFATSRGYNWNTLADDLRSIFMEDVEYRERGLRRPRPGPGACQHMIVDIAPDFDAPFDDLKEYME